MNNPNSGGMKNIPGLKSLTPAVLGVASSHGMKLSPNMTSENKRELFTKLEEWRQARRDKLTASILAKQKLFEKTKISLPKLPLKTKQVPIRQEGGLKTQDKQSVFERLYKNSGKIKKPEITLNSSKPSQIPYSNFKKSKLLSYDKPIKSEKILHSRKTKIESLNKCPELGPVFNEVNKNEPFSHEVSAENQILDSINDIAKTENKVTGDQFPYITEKKACNEATASKPMKLDICLKNDQVSSTELKSVKSDSATKRSSFKLPSKTAEVERQKNPLRRSISMMFRQKCKTNFGITRSISAKNLHEIDLNLQKLVPTSLENVPQSFGNIKKKTESEAVTKFLSFNTPKHNVSLMSTHLRTKLENWLNINGHSLEGYRHLRCFGIVSSGKSLLRAPAQSENVLENSYYATAPNTPLNDSDKENVTPPTVKQRVDVEDVENWLKELHRLISEVKYPSERCEEWLNAIRKIHAGCTQLPIYWECLAALHESKGDLKSAIEDYERAIVKGGEIDVVGNSLAELFDKLVIEQKKSCQRKLERGLDPKNIFKSTIIKFALQQKALKKLSSELAPSVREQLYIATPVRRSTRIQTPFKSTEVDSLQNLTPELLKSVEFKPNESLLNGN